MDGDDLFDPEHILEFDIPESTDLFAQLGNVGPVFNEFFPEGNQVSQQQEQTSEYHATQEQEVAAEENILSEDGGAQSRNLYAERENPGSPMEWAQNASIANLSENEGSPMEWVQNGGSMQWSPNANINTQELEEEGVLQEHEFDGNMGQQRLAGSNGNNILENQLMGRNTNEQKQAGQQSASHHGYENTNRVGEDNGESYHQGPILPLDSMPPLEFGHQEHDRFMAVVNRGNGSRQPNEFDSRLAGLRIHRKDQIQNTGRDADNQEFGENLVRDMLESSHGNAEHGPPQQVERQTRGRPLAQRADPAPGRIEQEGRETRYPNQTFIGGNHSHYSAMPTTGYGNLNNPEFSENFHQDLREQQAAHSRQRQEWSQGEVLLTEDQDQKDMENLQWISSMVRCSQNTESQRNTHQGVLHAHNLQAQQSERLPGQEPHMGQMEVALSGWTAQVRNLWEGGLGLLFGKTHKPGAQGIVLHSTVFSSKFTGMRLAGSTFEEIVEAIDVPRLPSLDDEMEFGFQEEESEKIPWTVQASNSPTLARIAGDVKQIGALFSISSDLLFNHLFCLSRGSFLQREERVHLELVAHFLSTWRVDEPWRFEQDAKDLIIWLETNFASANLAALVQKLVNGVDDNGAIRHLVQVAKVNYTPRPVEMTLLGAFYTLMNKHSDIIESNRRIARVNRKVLADIKKAKSDLENLEKEVPKNRKGRTTPPDVNTVMAREIGMIATFAATRWLIVGSADSHYAYGCSILEAAGKVHKYVGTEQTMKIETLRDTLSNLGRRRHGAGGENQVTPAPMVVTRVDLMRMHKEEQLRPVYAVERTLLCCFANTLRSLGRIKVAGLLRSVGGRIPTTFAMVLAEKENEIEMLRGVGYIDGLVVDDIVRAQEIVEKENAKNKRDQRLLERKEAYLQVCQDLINGRQPAEAVPSNTRVRPRGWQHRHSLYGTRYTDGN